MSYWVVLFILDASTGDLVTQLRLREPVSSYEQCENKGYALATDWLTEYNNREDIDPSQQFTIELNCRTKNGND